MVMLFSGWVVCRLIDGWIVKKGKRALVRRHICCMPCKHR